MGLLSKLGLGPKDAAEAVIKTAEGAADIVERWKPSEQAKHNMSREDYADKTKATQEARAYDPRTTMQETRLLGAIGNFINLLVDSANRMIRPGLAVTLMGGLFGWWEVKLNTSDPLLVELSIAVFGFYFGVRAITQDLPRLLRALKDLRKS